MVQPIKLGPDWSKLARPKTKGMVERFNDRESEVIKQTQFGSMVELKASRRK